MLIVRKLIRHHQHRHHHSLHRLGAKKRKVLFYFIEFFVVVDANFFYLFEDFLTILIFFAELDIHTQFQEAFVKILNDETPRQQKDTVDSYLEQIDDILHRLPYIQRQNLQRRMMDLAIKEENEYMENKENNPRS